MAVATLFNGTRVIDCGAHAAGGFEAGRRFAEICMAGLGRAPPPRWSSTAVAGLTVTTDHPAVACWPRSTPAGGDYEGYFAMGSGPGRALIHAEDLYDDLGWHEHANAAVLCLESAMRRRRGRRLRRAARAALSLLMAPTASVAGGVQIAARVGRDGAPQAPRARLRRAAGRRRLRYLPAPPVAATTWRRSATLLYGGQVHLTVEAEDDDDDALRDLVQRLPASASSASRSAAS